VVAAKAGMAKVEVTRSQNLTFISEMPFDSTIKRMSVAYRDDDGHHDVVYAKGAFESIYGICDTIRVKGQDIPIDPKSGEWSLTALQTHVDSLAKNGLRVLALATRKLPSNSLNCDTPRETLETSLTLLGFAGIMDPPRPEVY